MPPHNAISACTLVCNKNQNSARVCINMTHVPQALYTTDHLFLYCPDEEDGDLIRCSRPRGIPKTHVVSTVCKYSQLLLFFDLTANCSSLLWSAMGHICKHYGLVTSLPSTARDYPSIPHHFYPECVREVKFLEPPHWAVWKELHSSHSINRHCGKLSIIYSSAPAVFPLMW